MRTCYDAKYTTSQFRNISIKIRWYFQGYILTIPPLIPTKYENCTMFASDRAQQYTECNIFTSKKLIARYIPLRIK